MIRSQGSRTLVLVLVLWALLFPIDSSARDSSRQASPADLTPDNTVILANQADARFSRDFSPLLKSLRVEWAIVDSAAVPDSVRDRNVILLGRPDSAYTGEIMRDMLTAAEIETARDAAEGHLVLARASPWTEGRSVHICTGADLLLTRNAAEEAVRDIIARALPASSWIQMRFDAPLDEDVRETVDRLRYSWDDAELPLADLRMDVGAKPRRRISAQQAAEDVERLFYLFSHGYSGYAFFNQHGEFAQAKARILAQVSSRDSWSSKDLAQLFYDQLGFITDCHLNIGDYQYAGHMDFWYDTSVELAPAVEGFQITVDGNPYAVLSINGQAPKEFTFPSLNAQGEPIYRLGTLSETEPAPLQLVAEGGAGERQFEIALQRSDFGYYSDDVFREENLGGIPVLRVRNFGDVNQDELSRFVQTASAHKGDPVIIVDARGNSGGNETWPVQWLQALTGRRHESVFIFSELHNKTTMAGRANLFDYYYDLYSDIDAFRQDAAWTTSAAQAYEDGTREPQWIGPLYPQMSLIPNDTTLIIVMNGLVASAGEGLIMRASRAENVVLVGENSRGALTFGNGSTHLLPHSRLKVNMPINFGLYLDMEFREGKGIAPDLWVPAADAVNYAVAAVRRGTITTRQPLPASTLAQPFVAENPWARAQKEIMVRWLLAGGITVAAGLWAYFTRRKPLLVAVVGTVWIAVGSTWIGMEQPAGLGFLFAGVVCAGWGGLNLILARKTAQDTAA